MNRFIRSGLGVVMALGLSAAGMGAASATEKDDSKGGHDKPEVVKIDEKYVLDAGTACRDKIKVHEKAAFKIFELNKHKSLLVWKHGSYATFYNPKTHKKITVGESGKALLKERGDDTKVQAYGENIFIGSGIKGIVYVKGGVKFTVCNDGQEDQKIVIHKVKGKYVELCKKLGSKPAYHHDDDDGHGYDKKH